MRPSVLGLIMILAACDRNPVEGSYHADDGEGSRAKMILDGGAVQFWQGDPDLPPLTGHYTQEDGLVTLSLGGQTMQLSFTGNCLHPDDDPSQAICKIE